MNSEQDSGCLQLLTDVLLDRCVDLSNEVADDLVKAVEWNLLSREWNLIVSGLSFFCQASVLKRHLPDRVEWAVPSVGQSFSSCM